MSGRASVQTSRRSSLFLLVISAFVAPLHINGQEGTAAQTRSGRFVAGIGATFGGERPEFSREICAGPEMGLEARAGRRLQPWFSVVASAAINSEVVLDECINGLHLPPPDSGAVTSTDYSGVEGYPYAALGVRVLLEQAGPEIARGRGYLGVEWFPGKGSVVSLIAGLGMGWLVGDRLVLVLDGEVRAMRIPENVVTVQFRRGQLVSVDRVGHGYWRAQPRIRLGMEHLF